MRLRRFIDEIAGRVGVSLRKIMQRSVPQAVARRAASQKKKRKAERYARLPAFLQTAGTYLGGCFPVTRFHPLPAACSAKISVTLIATAVAAVHMSAELTAVSFLQWFLGGGEPRAAL